MAIRKKQRPYRELGDILEEWRSTRFRSALALFKEAKFSFSYSAYVDFEKGLTLPAPQIILDLAQFFVQDPKSAILAWARVQMPSPELKTLFASVLSASVTAGAGSNSTPPATDTKAPSFENTWVFGPTERALLVAKPWLWEVCLKLSMSYPDEVPFAALPEPALVRTHTAPWIDGGFITASGTGLKLHYPHLHIPRTPEWNDIRKANIRRALDALLENITPPLMEGGRGYRELVHRSLTPTQAARFTERLKQIEAEFKGDPYVDESAGTPDRTHALLMVLGPRKLN